jgi:hypothetical protein
VQKRLEGHLPTVISILGPVDPAFRALSGRLKFTVQRHKFNSDSLTSDLGVNAPEVSSLGVEGT